MISENHLEEKISIDFVQFHKWLFDARPPPQVWREGIGVEHVAQPQKVVKDGHCKEEPKEVLVGFVVGA